MRLEETVLPSIEDILRAHGVKWVKKINPFDMYRSMQVLIQAYHSKEKLKVIISDAECTLAKGRREIPLEEKAITAGKRIERLKYLVDDKICSGCFPCEKYSGCPSVTLLENPNPLRTGNVKKVMVETCTGCGVCGVTNLFGLCPSTYRVKEIHNPSAWERFAYSTRRGVISILS